MVRVRTHSEPRTSRSAEARSRGDCRQPRGGDRPRGEPYFHNVRVNGILPAEGGPSLWTLLALLNSAALDYVFRRGAGEHANGYFAANKQFIAPLPIRVPEGTAEAELAGLGQRLHACAAAIGAERDGFLAWLGDLSGGRIGDLAGHTQLAEYERRDLAELIEILRRNRSRLRADPTTRAFHDALASGVAESRTRLAALSRDLESLRREAEERVGDLYELTAAQRRLVADDSPTRR